MGKSKAKVSETESSKINEKSEESKLVKLFIFNS